MNTLIAILGDTYEKITEKKQLYSLTQRTKLYANYMTFIKFNPVVNQKYLYVIRPQPDDDDNQQWEGAVTSMKNRIKKSQEALAKDLTQLQKRIIIGQETVVNELKHGQKNIKDESRSELKQVKDDIQRLEAKFDKANTELRAEVDKKFSTVSSELSEVKSLLKTLIETNKKA